LHSLLGLMWKGHHTCKIMISFRQLIFFFLHTTILHFPFLISSPSFNLRIACRWQILKKSKKKFSHLRGFFFGRTWPQQPRVLLVMGDYSRRTCALQVMGHVGVAGRTWVLVW